jgi:3-oxoacyl-[acyl-carrier protein] reductase
MNFSLIGKNALVGGGSAGIGRAVALELALLGANVTVLARTESSLIATKDMLDTSLGQKHGLLVADYADSLSMQMKVQMLVTQFPVHILVNNTGGPAGGPLVDAKEEDLLDAYHKHLICNHLLTKTVLPGMKETGFGRIINIISTSVKEPIEGLGVSNTTRWAVASWAKTLSIELGCFGITVNNVLPGFTQTARLEEIIEKRVAKSGTPRAAVEAGLMDQVPLKRFALPEEVAAAAAFLATPAASYINGINLPVDGGRTKSL